MNHKLASGEKFLVNNQEVMTVNLYGCELGEEIYKAISTNQDFVNASDWDDLSSFFSSRVILRAELGILYHNIGSSTVIVTVPANSDYVTPNGGSFTITIPPGGYAEVSVLRLCTNMPEVSGGATPEYLFFVRGI